jgi:hypothetical protein
MLWLVIKGARSGERVYQESPSGWDRRSRKLSVPYNERMKPIAAINSPIPAVWPDERLLEKC